MACTNRPVTAAASRSGSCSSMRSVSRPLMPAGDLIVGNATFHLAMHHDQLRALLAP
jgi:hypothetical protein